MTGAIPVFLTPKRNHLGIIGPIPKEEFTAESIARKIEANPFARNAKIKKPRILTITQSTYDGVLYNDETLKTMLDGAHRQPALRRGVVSARVVPRLLSQHARDRAGTGRGRRTSMVYATQSTHKMLAGLSQASQILVSESETVKLDPTIFNEAFLMHTSTSPQYAIIASCDIAAAMMEPPGGTALVEESILEALDFRRAMRKIDAEFGDDWWFKVWGPEELVEDGIGEPVRLGAEVPTTTGTASATSRRTSTCWTRSSRRSMTPGLDVSGKFADVGIPASIVTRYLAEHGVIVEKTGLYSFFIMFTIGITKGRWNTLLTALQQFKDDYDRNQPMWRILPEFVKSQPELRARRPARPVPADPRHVPAARRGAGDDRDVLLSDMQPAMKPSEAYACMAHREIDRVPIEELEGASPACC